MMESCIFNDKDGKSKLVGCTDHVFGTGAIARLHSERLHYSTAARYNGMYNFLKGNKTGTDVPSMSCERNHLNRVMYPGLQQNYSNGTKSYSKISYNRGHWEGNATVRFFVFVLFYFC